MKICNFNWPISIEQTGTDSFTVAYGADIRTNLSWDQATKEIGASIMHSLKVEGEINDYADK